MEDILQISFLQNTILDYVIFLATFLVGAFIVRIIKSIVLIRLKAWAEKTVTNLDDFLIHIIEKKLMPVLYFGVFYVSTNILTLHPRLSKGIDIIGIVLLTFIAINVTVELLKYFLKNYWAKKDADANRERAVQTIFPILKVIVWGIGITFLLDNLGFKISVVVAGLGIGGIAVALAAQAILGDLFSYFVIFFDRPFEIGDFIIIGDFMGSIEHIGIKTTKIRSLGGEQLVFSNTDLTNARLRNYKRMTNRRVVFKLGVTYQTSLQLMKEIPVIITTIIKNVEGSTFDRAHFSSYGDFSLDIEVVYYVIGGDYTKYMDIQQEINVKIMEEFEKRGIEFAYPTQTLFVEKTKENK
jgi:small-conductance mechanosensitive channel